MRQILTLYMCTVAYANYSTSTGERPDVAVAYQMSGWHLEKYHIVSHLLVHAQG